jgi:hypothetical protein
MMNGNIRYIPDDRALLGESPKIASKLPRGSNSTSQQIGQIANAMVFAE